MQNEKNLNVDNFKINVDNSIKPNEINNNNNDDYSFNNYSVRMK